MNTIPPSAPPGKPGHPPTPPQRAAAAERRHHELQVGLACGEPNSLAADEALEDYARAVGEAHAANAARRAELLEGLRLLADDGNDRLHAARLLAEVAAGVPLGDLVGALVGHRQAIEALRKEAVALWVEVLDLATRAGALEKKVAALESPPAGSAVGRE